MKQHRQIKHKAIHFISLAMKWQFIGLLCLSTPVMAREQTIAALRSAYLYYFSNLIEWPQDVTFINSELLICAITSNADNRFQLHTIAGKRVGDLHIATKIIGPKQLNQLTYSLCHILYIAEDSIINNTKIAAPQPSVLLVTEGSALQAGHIHLFLENNKLKFEIDSEKLNNNKFKASSQLMRLSRNRDRSL